jgi:hypothetical protein
MSITEELPNIFVKAGAKLECIILSVPGIVQVSLFTWEYNLQKLANWFPIINYYCGIYIWTLALLTVCTEVLNIHIYVQSRSWLVPVIGHFQVIYLERWWGQTSSGQSRKYYLEINYLYYQHMLSLLVSFNI